MAGALSAPLPLWLLLRLLLLVALPAAGWLTTSTPGPPSTAPQDGIRINVTTMKDNGEISKEQVVLNITYERGQVCVNGSPVSSGVTRISCRTLIVKSKNLENLEEKEYFGSVTVRILVREWPLTSGSSSQLIVIQEEVVEIDGKQAQQKDVIEIDILVKNQRILRHSNYSLPLEESMLYSISRESDILFTLPNFSKKVMCQWVEKLQRALRVLASVFPVMFMFLNVMVVGVLGAAAVITVLKVLFPVYENKGVLQVDKMNAVYLAPIILYSDDSEETAEKLKDKTCI